jgi:hypothetical protein
MKHALLISTLALALALFYFTPRLWTNGGAPQVGLVEPSGEFDIKSDSTRHINHPTRSQAERAPALGTEPVDSSRATPLDEVSADEEGKFESDLNRVISYHSRYQDSIGRGLALQVQAEYDFAIACAVATLKAEGKGQHELDYDNGSQKGFGLGNPTSDLIEVVADGVKYQIFPIRFPATGVALSRAKAWFLGTGGVDALSPDEVALYEQCYADAMLVLGVK